MNTNRTLPEDRRGFAAELGKTRNLLNSAGTGRRKGTLGARTTTTALNRRGHGRTAKVRIPGATRTRDYAPPRHPIHAYLGYVDRFPNVLDCFRNRPAAVADVSVSLGAGRGW